MADPAGFVAAADSQANVEAGIAAAIEGVAAGDVAATLTVGSAARRLGEHEAASGTVDVAAVITAADADTAVTIQAAAALVSNADMGAAIAEATGVEMTATGFIAALSAAPASAPSPAGSDDDGAFKPAVMSKIVAGLVAVFFSF